MSEEECRKFAEKLMLCAHIASLNKSGLSQSSGESRGDCLLVRSVYSGQAFDVLGRSAFRRLKDAQLYIFDAAELSEHTQVVAIA